MKAFKILAALTLALLLPLPGSGPIGGDAAATITAPADARDYGFRFASAVQTDPTGKGSAQARMLMIYLSQGDVDRARDLAHHVEGWWRGVALAEVAVRLASEGRAEEARQLVKEAEEFRKTVEGWQNPRISAHVAHALALLGDDKKARAAGQLALDDDPQQYAGQVAAATSSGLARHGDFDSAMAELRALDPREELMVASWRTSGYIQLSQEENLTREQRTEALEAALESLGGVPGWNQVDSMQLIALEFDELGLRSRAADTLESAEEMIVPTGGRPTRPPTLLADVARSWAKIGRPKRGAKLLLEAEKAVLHQANIDQPGLYAQVAAAYFACSNTKEAWRLLDKAFAAAEALSNSRPRALAVVEICRWMAMEKIELTTSARLRLDHLYEGLGDPW